MGIYNLLVSHETKIDALSFSQDRVDKKNFIPIARSYDGNNWQPVEGKYVSSVSVELCGEAEEAGDGYSQGDYLCQVKVPLLKDDSSGYYLISSNVGALSNNAMVRTQCNIPPR